MRKDFRDWSVLKETVQSESDDRYFREREIWWCRIGLNIGFEQDGKGESFSRPILIIKKFNKHVFWGIPLSTQKKPNPYYLPCLSSDGKLRFAIISQIRLISVKRLTNKMSIVREDSYREIKRALKALL